jgi:hypothetical protein
VQVPIGLQRGDVVACASALRSRPRELSFLPSRRAKQANRDNSFFLSGTADSSEQLIGASRLGVPKMNRHR